MRAIADRVVLQATSLGASVVRVRPPRLRWASGRVPIASVSQRSNRRKAASLIASMGTLNANLLRLRRLGRTRTVVVVRVTSNNRSRGPAFRWKLGASVAGRDFAPAAPVRLSRPAPQLHPA